MVKKKILLHRETPVEGVFKKSCHQLKTATKDGLFKNLVIYKELIQRLQAEE